MSTADEALDLALELAREGADLAARRRAEGVDVAATKSSLADIVTAADREVEALIRARLERDRPADGFLGEESGAGESRSGLVWVVDPIDGTVNYAAGIPAWAVSIAVVEGVSTDAEGERLLGPALAGVVANPLTGETFFAARGAGAWLERGGARTRLHVNEGLPAAGLLVGTGFGYAAERRAEQFAVLARVLPHARDIRRIGAASLDLASVAAGRLDAYYERGLAPWDHAAGALLVREAGGIIAGAAGGPESSRLIIAGGAAAVQTLAPLVDA